MEQSSIKVKPFSSNFRHYLLLRTEILQKTVDVRNSLQEGPGAFFLVSELFWRSAG